MAATTCRITKHGTHQLELNVLHRLDEAIDIEGYDLDVYFYVSGNLAGNAGQYGVTQFFGDLRSYVRLLPSSLTFLQLADPMCQASPLARIRKILDDTIVGRQLDSTGVLYELRMLVNLHHEEFRNLRQILQPLFLTPGAHADLIEKLTTLLQDHERFLQEFRRCRQHFTDTRIPESLREALTWADEAISIKTGRECHKLRTFCEGKNLFLPLRDKLVEKCKQEQRHRAANCYPTLIDPTDPISGERFLCRESILKKWAQSATYMSVMKSKIGTQMGHLMAGVAAAAAMIFAVLAMLLAERLFPTYSLPWIFLIIVSYMFKDRIKEIFRGLLLQCLPRLVADERKSLIDPGSMKKAGRSVARVRFMCPAEVPEPIHRLRQNQQEPFWHVLPSDLVIHYHNTVSIRSERLRKSHLRLEGVNSIMRLRTNTWMAQMDDPVNRVYYIDGDTPSSIEALRVYHFHAIICLSRKSAVLDRQYQHVRVVMTRNGIVRIENCG